MHRSNSAQGMWSGYEFMAIIDSTLTLIRDSLNNYLRNLNSNETNWVSLSNVIKLDGQPYEEAKNKVVMFLADIQHETSISTYQRTVPASGAYVAVAPPLYVDLFLLFYANFPDDNYIVSLRMISWTISYFQQNPCFTRSTLPALNPAIEKLTFEFMNLDATSLNYLMGLVGVKYLPSVYYKLRMIPFTSDMVQEVVPVAKGVGAAGAPQEGQTNLDPGRQSVSETEEKNKNQEHSEAAPQPKPLTTEDTKGTQRKSNRTNRRGRRGV